MFIFIVHIIFMKTITGLIFLDFLAGCEFFKEWKDNSYTGETMTFDWSQVS